MLTNLKLVNVKLTKENIGLKEMLLNNKNSRDPVMSPGTPDIMASNIQIYDTLY